MSNKQTKQQETVPFDFITENKSLNYNISILEGDVTNMKQRNTNLKDIYINLEKEYETLKTNFKIMFDDMKTVKDMTVKLEQTQNKLTRTEYEFKEKEKEFEAEKENLIKYYETEIIRLKQLLETNSKKIESYNQLHHASEKQEEQLKALHKEIDKIKAESEQRVQSNLIKHEIKFATVKKKMVETVNDMQNNVSQLNMETMDTSSKLILLQNHQLLIDLEFQSQEVEELLVQKNALQRKVTELQYDLDVSAEVQKQLLKKYNKIKDKEKQYTPAVHIPVVKSLNLTIDTYESKFRKAETMLSKRENEIKDLKFKIKNLDEDRNYIEKRNHGLYKLFEEGLNYLIEYESLKNASEIFIDIDSIKRADFTSLSLKEKYSLLVIFINFILKHIKPEFLSQIEEFKENENISEVNGKYLVDKKIVPYWKKLNLSDIPMMNPVRRNVQGLPIITNYRYKL